MIDDAHFAVRRQVQVVLPTTLIQVQLLHASTDKVPTCMRDDKSMTRLVMYSLETRLDAFHCRYDDESWQVLFLQSHGALPQSMEEGIHG